MRISKSKFVAGVQCLRRLYWQVHEPELAAQPDAAAKARLEQGHQVGLLARQLLPGGVEVESHDGLGQAIRTTRELVAKKSRSGMLPDVTESEKQSSRPRSRSWRSSSSRGPLYPSKSFRMLSHSSSSGSRQTGLPARPYQ